MTGSSWLKRRCAGATRSLRACFIPCFPYQSYIRSAWFTRSECFTSSSIRSSRAKLVSCGSKANRTTGCSHGTMMCQVIYASDCRSYMIILDPTSSMEDQPLMPPPPHLPIISRPRIGNTTPVLSICNLPC